MLAKQLFKSLYVHIFVKKQTNKQKSPKHDEGEPIRKLGLGFPTIDTQPGPEELRQQVASGIQNTLLLFPGEKKQSK